MNYEKSREENNVAVLAGEVCETPKKSHEIDNEKFYEFSVSVKRLSGQVDTIPVTISERTLMDRKLEKGDFVQVQGEYRSYNRLEGQRSKLILHLFAKDFKTLEETRDENEVKLVGFICKEPVYRKTPFEREICDVLLAVNRQSYGKSDYIPCILWGRNARFMAEQGIGCKIEITGRIQSREYTKKFENGQSEIKTAYEVSCQNIAVLSNVTKLQNQNDTSKVVAVND